MKVTYYYSACVKISTKSFSILCDPWFTEPIYDGSWYHFPAIDVNPIDLIGDVDLIYISHIHPDHYDKEFLNSYFNKYGKKDILIADWSANYLSKVMLKDGFSPTIIKRGETKAYAGVSVKIYPQDGRSKSDVDSALIISSVDSNDNLCTIVNANDVIFDDKTLSDISELAPNIDLLMLSYTGAGPYPQTFYDLDDPSLKKESDQKKKQFFDRYKKVVEGLKPTYTLPFAGKYILGGELVELNVHRGVSDPLEVTYFDKKALIPRDMGGEVNLSAIHEFLPRVDLYSHEMFQERLTKLSGKKFNYQEDISDSFMARVNIAKLLEIASHRALRMSECDFDYFYSIELPAKCFAVINANKNKPLEFKLISDLDKLPYPRTDIRVNLKYLFGLLMGVYHWDNARIGSHVQTRRRGTTYNKSAEVFLNFLHI